MRQITNENAAAYPVRSFTLNYCLGITSFDGKTVNIGLYKQLVQYDREPTVSDAELLFEKPIDELPPHWRDKTFELEFHFHSYSDGEWSTNCTLHIIKSIYVKKELRPLFDENGSCYASDEYFLYTKKYLGNEAKREIKLAHYTLEERPEALLWVLDCQGEQKNSERRLVSEELKKKVGFERSADLWAVPTYVNDKYVGVLFKYDRTFNWRSYLLPEAEFLALPKLED